MRALRSLDAFQWTSLEPLLRGLGVRELIGLPRRANAA